MAIPRRRSPKEIYIVYLGKNGSFDQGHLYEGLGAAKRFVQRKQPPTALIFSTTGLKVKERLRWSYTRKGYLSPRLDRRPHDPIFREMYAPKKTGWKRH